MDDVDEEGRTSLLALTFINRMLHWAADRGNMLVLLELLNHNASVSVRDNEQLTPLDYACICENNDIVAVLVCPIQLVNSS